MNTTPDLRGLEAESKAVAAALLQTGVAWVELPAEWEYDGRYGGTHRSRAYGRCKTLTARFGHPVKCVVQREPDGDGMVYYFEEGKSNA